MRPTSTVFVFSAMRRAAREVSLVPAAATTSPLSASISSSARVMPRNASGSNGRAQPFGVRVNTTCS